MSPGTSRLYKALLLILVVLSLAGGVFAEDKSRLDFSLHKHGTGKPEPTLLIIGGIQGDEPGGFNAASLLVTDYQIEKGNVWIVPNLNFESIVRRSRGVHGDMNRKFLELSINDPEYSTVQKIKKIILDKQVDVILNLHDGSGFYRPEYIDYRRNPSRWGQSVIIDQAVINKTGYGDLAHLAGKVITRVNRRINNKEHRYFLKNTRTRNGNREMEKTLTYFAVRNKKAAFGVEASKSFNTHYRALYHLQVVEAFMDEMGIQYRRSFQLHPRHVKRAIDKGIQLAMYNNKLYLDMTDARSWLRYVPMKRGEPLQVAASNPLVAVVDSKKHFKVRYGNRGVTNLHPEYLDFDDSLDNIPVLADNRYLRVRPGAVVEVDDNFMVLPQQGYRVNIIGYAQRGVENEAGIFVSQADIMRRFSIDRQARKYRIEIYRNKKFSGMILVNFSKNQTTSDELAYYPSELN